MYRPLVTKILEEASKCYGDDSPLEDPVMQLGYNQYAVKKAVYYCRSEGLLGKRALFGKNVETVSAKKTMNDCRKAVKPSATRHDSQHVSLSCPNFTLFKQPLSNCPFLT